MDKGYEKERFESLSIKTSVVQKFRNYCRKISESQSMALLHMIQFFELNGLSPHDNLDETISSLKGLFGKRFNGLVAIIKSIEKSQTKPTAVMLQSLFKETTNIEKEEESYEFETPKLITENEELTYFRNSYFTTQEQYSSLLYDIETIVKNTKYFKGNFGPGHFKLDITKEEFTKLKQKLKDVHHDNPTKTR